MTKINLKLMDTTKNIDGTLKRPRPGFPWHYGHFIHDVVLPFSHIYLQYLENGKTIKNTTLSDSEKQTIGTFETHFNTLFGISHKEITKNDFIKRKQSIVKLEQYGFGPYPRQYAIPLKRYIYNKFSLTKTPPQQICIIKRGVSKLRFDNSNRLRYKTGKDKPRDIANFGKLKQEIRKKYILKEIVLDNMTIKDQLEIFANCKCLIGIHGAGMTNVVWLQDKSLLIEIKKKGLPNSIKHLSNASNCDYNCVIPDDKLINVKSIIDILDNKFGSGQHSN